MSCDTNTTAENGSEFFLCVNVCVLIDKIFNFDGSTNADFKCDQSLNLKANITYETKRESNNLLNHLTEPISESKKETFIRCLFCWTSLSGNVNAPLVKLESPSLTMCSVRNRDRLV